MSEEMIVKIIQEMNNTFEYYFEEYNDISSSKIWWYFDAKNNRWKHVINDCKQQGDLAVYYYTHGYCALYANTLKELFPKGQCFWDISGHMLFYYQKNFYDASGTVHNNKEQLFEIQSPMTPTDLHNFSKFANITSHENLNLIYKMKQQAKKILNEEKEKIRIKP